MKNRQVLGWFLKRTWIVWVAKLFFFSLFGIRLAKALLFIRYLFRNIRLWPEVTRYSELLLGERARIRSPIRYFNTQADQIVWATLAHEAWDSVLKYHEFSAADELRAIAGRGKGLLVLGIHYGPRFTSYLLHRNGLKPVILADKVNIPDVDGVSLKPLLSNESIFRGTYDGFLEAGHSEKSFVKMMLEGRPGVILNDMFSKRNFVSVKLLGIDFPIGVFPFKLALRHAFPAAIVWFTKIKGRGYKLNVREIHFGTVEEGVAQYAALLEHVVMADPYPWYFALSYVRRRRIGA